MLLKYLTFLKKNAVCKMADILCRPHCDIPGYQKTISAAVMGSEARGLPRPGLYPFHA